MTSTKTTRRTSPRVTSTIDVPRWAVEVLGQRFVRDSLAMGFSAEQVVHLAEWRCALKDETAALAEAVRTGTPESVQALAEAREAVRRAEAATFA